MTNSNRMGKEMMENGENLRSSDPTVVKLRYERPRILSIETLEAAATACDDAGMPTTGGFGKTLGPGICSTLGS